MADPVASLNLPSVNKNIVKSLLSDPEVVKLIKASDYKTLFSENSPIKSKVKQSYLAKALYLSIGNKMLVGVEVIPDSLFSSFYELKEIAIPEGVRTIGTGAFYGCVSMNKISLPKSLVRICSMAFKQCSSLESIVIPENVQDIDDNAFNGCPKLKEIKFEGAPFIYYSAFTNLGTASDNWRNDIRKDMSGTKVYFPEFDNDKISKATGYSDLADNKRNYETSLSNLKRTFPNLEVY